MLKVLMEYTPYISVQEAAELLGISRQRVDQLIQDGRLSVAYRAGRDRLLERETVLQLKKTRETA